MKRKEESLLDNDILRIIIGDKQIGNELFIENKMPYLSGKKVCLLGQELGLNIYYNSGEYIGYSRLDYIKDVVNYCIKNNKISELFNELTKTENFTYLADISYNNGIMDYWRLISELQMSINNILIFHGVQLLKENNMWYIKEIDDESKIVPLDEKTDVNYIRKKYDEINDEIDNDKYNHAVTLTKNMLEKTLKILLDKKEEKYTTADDINDLYKKIKKLYSLNIHSGMNEPLKKIISGLNSIISGISEIRNLTGDAHEHAENEFGLRKFDLKMLASSAEIVCEYLLNVMESEKGE